MMTLLPWHHDPWHQMTDMVRPQRPLLFLGVQGLGKSQFAYALAKAYLCESQSDFALVPACGHCPSCSFFEAQTHPDFFLVQPIQSKTSADQEPAKKGGQIQISQIRDLSDLVHQKGQVGGARVILIEPAHLMGESAQHALLKMLEDENSTSFFILISNKIEALLGTLTSRCHQVFFRAPPLSVSIDWLSSFGVLEDKAKDFLPFFSGAPLLAKTQLEEDNAASIKELLENALKHVQSQGHLSKFFQTWCHDLSEKRDDLLQYLLKVLYDAFMIQVLSQPARYLPASFQAMLKNCLRRPSKSMNIPLYFRGLDKLLELRKEAPFPLQNELRFEEIALVYSTTFLALQYAKEPS